MPPIIDILGKLIPIVGSTVTDVVTLVAALKATANQHGYDLDTQVIDERIAEDTRRQQIAVAEAGGPPTE